MHAFPLFFNHLPLQMRKRVGAYRKQGQAGLQDSRVGNQPSSVLVARMLQDTDTLV